MDPTCHELQPKCVPLIPCGHAYISQEIKERMGPRIRDR
jgi:hypothetical protein